MAIRSIADGTKVYEWDRGLSLPATTSEVQMIVDFLVEGLADFIYAGNNNLS
jgi:hypothetical protein